MAEQTSEHEEISPTKKKFCYGFAGFFLYAFTLHWPVTQIYELAIASTQKALQLSILTYLVVATVYLIKADTNNLDSFFLRVFQKVYCAFDHLEFSKQLKLIKILAVLGLLVFAGLLASSQANLSHKVSRALTGVKVEGALMTWTAKKQSTDLVDVFVYLESRPSSQFQFKNIVGVGDMPIFEIHFRVSNPSDIENMRSTVATVRDSILAGDIPEYPVSYILEKDLEKHPGLGHVISSHGAFGIHPHSRSLMLMTIMIALISFVVVVPRSNKALITSLAPISIIVILGVMPYIWGFPASSYYNDIYDAGQSKISVHRLNENELTQ